MTAPWLWPEEKEREGSADSGREIKSWDGQAGEKINRVIYAPLAWKKEKLEPGSAK